MEKSVFDNFKSKLDSVGIEQYTIRFEGGNRSLFVNSDSCKVATYGNYIMAIEVDKNYGKIGSNFNITVSDYDYIDNVSTRGLSVKEAIDLLKAFGGEASSDEFMDFIAKRGIGSQPQIENKSNAGLEDYRDKDGNQVLDNPHSQYAIHATVLAPQNAINFSVSGPEDITDPDPAPEP